MKINFNQFINESSKKDDEKKFDEFLDNVKQELKNFKNTAEQAEEFITMYYDSLKNSFHNDFTVREAIVATKIPGRKILRGRVSESFIFNIDDKFENLYNKLEKATTKEELDHCYEGIEEYLKIDDNDFSDISLYERFVNNYKKLMILYNEKNDF